MSPAVQTPIDLALRTHVPTMQTRIPLPPVGAATIGRARDVDAPRIASLLEAAAPETIALSVAQVRARIDRFTVVRISSQVVAVTALHPLETGGVEVRSVAVDPQRRGSGLGRAVVRGALASDAARGEHAYCYTFRPGFFESLGFEPVDPDSVDVPERPDRPDRLDGRERRAMQRRPADARRQA